MTRMNRTFALLGAATLALVVSGCGKQGGAASDPAAVQSALKADEKQWNADFKGKNLEGLLSHYADNAFLAAGEPAANGSTEIRKEYTNALADNYFSVTFASDRIDSSGDLAYARGHYTEKHEDQKTQKIVTTSGSYLTVYKKQSDGSWKAIEDLTSPDPTTTKSEPVVVKPAKMISF
jgi:ketosteroid isomerase-like protein